MIKSCTHEIYLQRNRTKSLDILKWKCSLDQVRCNLSQLLYTDIINYWIWDFNWISKKNFLGIKWYNDFNFSEHVYPNNLRCNLVVSKYIFILIIVLLQTLNFTTSIFQFTLNIDAPMGWRYPYNHSWKFAQQEIRIEYILNKLV